MKSNNKQLKAFAKFAILFAERHGPTERNERTPHVALSSLNEIQNQLELAASKELHLAKASLLEEYKKQLAEVSEQINLVLQTISRTPQFFADNKSIMHDLMSLRDYFEDVCVDRKDKSIAVVTKPIELEDCMLGRFEIKLQIPKDTSQKCSYRVVALDDQYFASDSSISHPHVQSEILCEGDATGVISRSLEQGRLLDFFQIVNSVLSTYNSESAYRRLDEWDDINCSDCGGAVRPDDTTNCTECSDRLCDHCYASCQTCDEYHCGECIRTCSGCLAKNCNSCSKHCSECEQSYCDDCYTNNDKCQSCLEKQDNHEKQPEQSETAVHADSVGQIAVPA